MNILVLGFFDRQNLGDDTYKFIFNNIVKSPNKLLVVSVDDCTNIAKDTNLVVIGGGEILNNYFIDKILSLINQSTYSGKIITLSTSAGYTSIIDSGKLDFIDYFVVRDTLCQEKLESRFGKENVSYMPDLAFSLLDHITPPSKSRNILSFFTCGSTGTNTSTSSSTSI